jgi:hypothetical protein
MLTHPTTLTVYKELSAMSNIYSRKNNYRKIYQDHHGPIPKDKDGRSLEIHHIDGNHSNNNISNLKLVTIQEHYNIHYAQEDWAACRVLALRLKLSLEEVSALAKKSAKKQIENGTFPGLDKEMARRRELEKVKNGTHPFVGGKIQSESNQKRLQSGEHHLLGPSQNLKRIKEGKHNLVGSSSNNTRLAEGRHPSQMKKICEYCNIQISVGMYKRWHGNNCKLKTVL